MQELAIYVHLPWCVKKCPYCDFNSHQLRGELPAEDYYAALQRDWLSNKTIWHERKLVSIFFGGGTPSLFPAAIIQKIINMICSDLNAKHEAIEITMEANPGTFEQQRFRDYRSAGVNRLSIGVQSFSDRQLKTLGRIHSATNAREAVIKSRAAGFDNINIDIMYALPGQNVSEAVLDLQTAIDLQPEHISWYQLTIEPNTLFARFKPPGIADNDAIADIHSAGTELLHRAGLAQYEVSAFARSGRQCRHNLAYWQFEDYLGIGAGAHSKWRDTDGSWRKENCKHPKQYLSKSHDISTTQARPLTTDDLIFEYFLNNLRLFKTIEFRHFEKSTGQSVKKLKSCLEEIANLELGKVSQSSLQLTAKGQLFLNDVQEIFLNPVHENCQ